MMKKMAQKKRILMKAQIKHQEKPKKIVIFTKILKEKALTIFSNRN